MLSYYTLPTQMRRNSYWLGLAIHQAREVQAYSYHDPRHSAQHRRTLKTLWWSCILRDRVLSLGTRRPLLITSEDFDFTLPPLTADDLTTDTSTVYPNSYNERTRQGLALITEHTCKLAVVLTDVLMLVTPRKEPLFQMSECEARRFLAEASKCRAFLDHWYNESRPIFHGLARVNDAHQSIHLYTNITYLYYQ
jgi:hypothetical protein